MKKHKEEVEYLIFKFNSPQLALYHVEMLLFELNHQFQGFASSDRIQYWEYVRKELLKLM